MASEMKKIVCFSTQLYDIPSGPVRKIFVLNLAAELDGIRDRKWNTDQSIVFHTFILQRVHLITSAKNICEQIDT